MGQDTLWQLLLVPSYCLCDYHGLLRPNWLLLLHLAGRYSDLSAASSYFDPLFRERNLLPRSWVPHSWLGTERQADISVWPLKPAINHTSCPAGTTQECINSAIQMAKHHYMKNKKCGRALLWLRGPEKNLSKYLRHLPCVKSHDCSSDSSVDASASPPLLCLTLTHVLLTSSVWHKAYFPPQLFYLFNTWGYYPLVWDILNHFHRAQLGWHEGLWLHVEIRRSRWRLNRHRSWFMPMA